MLKPKRAKRFVQFRRGDGALRRIDHAVGARLAIAHFLAVDVELNPVAIAPWFAGDGGNVLGRGEFSDDLRQYALRMFGKKFFNPFCYARQNGLHARPVIKIKSVGCINNTAHLNI